MLCAAHAAAAQPRPTVETGQRVYAILSEARRAYDENRTVALRATFQTQLVRGTPDARLPKLGLATIDFLESKFASADSTFLALISDPHAADELTTQAWLGRSVVAGQQGRLPAADSLASVALTLARRSGDKLGIGGSLLRLAQYRVRTAGAPAALALLAAADSFVAPSQREAAASISCARAQIRNVSADTLAYRDALRGLALIPAGRFRRLRSGCLFAIGQQFVRRGRSYIDSTDRYLRLAIAEQRALGDEPGRAASLQWLGSALSDAGRYSAAKRTLIEAVDVSDRSQNRSARSWALLGLGTINLDLGDDVSGVQQLVRSAADMRDRGDQVGYQATQIALFDVRLRRGDTAGVAAALPETEAVLLRLGDKLTRQRILQVRVSLARTRRDSVAARALAEELFAQSERDGRAVNTSYALLRGVTALESGALDAALTHFAVTDEKLRGSMYSYVRLARTAEIAARQRDLPLAERRLRAAHMALAEFRATLSEQELRANSFESAGFDQVDPDLGVATVIHALATGGRASAAFGLAAERRGRELTDALRRAGAMSDRDTQSSAKRARSAETLGSDSAVRAVLAPNEAMLFYVTGDRSEPTTVFVATRQSIGAATVMDADLLKPIASRLRRVIEAGDEADAVRRELGAAVLGPALPLLPSGITRLIVVADGPLQSIPFDVLRLPDGRTVLDRFDIALLGSPAVLPILRNRIAPTRVGALAFAVEQPGRASPLSGRMLPVLRRANGEARDVVVGRRGSTVLLGADARESVLYQSRAAVTALHIAAHAVVDPQMESRSAIMLSAGGGQDGDVHAWEMDRIGVSAGLVVLSACRTSQSEAGRGEGVRGFTTPFLLGGTQAVVATQWDLADRAAAELMREFNRQLRRGADTGAALRAAKQLLARRGRPPSEWAVFQLIGDPSYRTDVQ